MGCVPAPPVDVDAVFTYRWTLCQTSEAYVAFGAKTAFLSNG
tara:strand:+ start:624 stop:749 length:126 start_codon:yes stop_codon:yes gene_type:complete